MDKQRELLDLVSVGPATVDDFLRMDITSVDQLIGRDAHQMWVELQEVRQVRVDPCCEDVFAAAIAQAENPDLPTEQCKWPYWSKVRKSR